ncbi:MAG: hypothetical protein GKR90_08285 [Pseudomonadales bacterium]|nr:hypothetical protein [Pseudomonadales bacterium]
MDKADLSSGFRIDQIEVYPLRHMVVVDSLEHHLEPKVMQVLQRLAKTPNKIVTRQELLEAVWADVVVGDEVLSRAVSLLRTTFNDSSTEPKFIRTVPRQGYQLIVEPQPVQQRKNRAFEILLGGSFIIGLLYLVVSVWWPTDKPRIAILPPEIRDEALGPLGEAIRDQVSLQAVAVSELDVLTKRATFAIRDHHADFARFAASVDTDYFLDTELKFVNTDDYVADLALIAQDGLHVEWSHSVTASTEEELLIVMRGAISEMFTDFFAATESLNSPRAPETRATTEPAYQRYLHARHQWSLRGSRRINRAITLLEQAIELDPHFVGARIALAQAFALQPLYTSTPLATGFAAAEQVLSDLEAPSTEHQNDVMTLRGFMSLRLRHRQSAEERLLGVLATDPTHSLANYWYSIYLCSTGRSDLALPYIQAAAESDPLSGVLQERLATTYMWTGNLDAAQTHFKLARDLGYAPEGEQAKAYLLFLVMAKEAEQLRQHLRAMQLPTDWVTAFTEQLSDSTAHPLATDLSRQGFETGDLPASLQFGIWVVLRQEAEALASFSLDPKSPDIELLLSSYSSFLRSSPIYLNLIEKLGVSTPP